MTRSFCLRDLARSHRQGTEPQLHPGSQVANSLQTLRSRAIRAEVSHGKGGLQPLLLVGNTETISDYLSS